ncbi:MAG: aminotransferase class IV [Cyclobacteriaceae bacterium]
MSRLIESIKLLDGKFYNLFYHEQRMKYSLRMVFGSNETCELEKFLLEKAYPASGVHKCRIVYDDVSREVTFSSYEPRKVNRVKVVEDDTISYECKFLDRRHIDRLFGLRDDCDDVLIIRQGLVTDCSYSNIAFRKGDQWYTPQSALLKGTMRQKLIDQNKIQTREICKEDIRSFDTFRIINAMLEFGSPEIEVSDIVF